MSSHGNKEEILDPPTLWACRYHFAALHGPAHRLRWQFGNRYPETRSWIADGGGPDHGTDDRTDHGSRRFKFCGCSNTTRRVCRDRIIRRGHYCTDVAPTTAPTVAVGSASAASGTRPAGSTTTGTAAAGSASAVTGTRPAGSVTTGTTAAGSTTAGAGVTVFTDTKGRFSFSRPSAWVPGQSSSLDTVAQFSVTDPLGVVDISTETVPGSTTADAYLQAALVQIKQTIPDAQQMGVTQLKLDTEPATQIDYVGTASGTKIYFSQIFALHKGTAYVLTLGTQPADIDKLKQQAIVVIQTWKFLQ